MSTVFLVLKKFPLWVVVVTMVGVFGTLFFLWLRVSAVPALLFSSIIELVPMWLTFASVLSISTLEEASVT